MKINAVVESERLIWAKLDSWDAKLVEAVYEKIVLLTAQLEAAVVANAPVGRDNHGGALRASIHSSVRRSAEKIAGIVTASVPYLPVIEFGLHKSLSVSGHEQTLTHAWARDIDPVQVFVDPYVRMANVEETLFMQRALESIAGEVVDELRAVIDENSGEMV